jgi:hypothetical protein
VQPEGAVIITRKNIIKYWASEPERMPVEDGFIRLDGICFPDLATLSPEEKEILRPVLQAHPEYLLETYAVLHISS